LDNISLDAIAKSAGSVYCIDSSSSSSLFKTEKSLVRVRENYGSSQLSQRQHENITCSIAVSSLSLQIITPRQKKKKEKSRKNILLESC